MTAEEPGDPLGQERPAGQFHDFESAQAQEIRRILAGDEVTPGVGGAETPPLADPQQRGPQRIQGADQDPAPRLQQSPAVAQQALDILGILEEVVQQNAIEAPRGVERRGFGNGEIERGMLRPHFSIIRGEMSIRSPRLGPTAASRSPVAQPSSSTAIPRGT